MELSTDDHTLVDDVVKQTLDHIKEHAPDEFKKLEVNPHQIQSIINAAKNAASEQVFLSKHLQGEPKNVEEILRMHLPESRVDLIKGGLNIPTFKMEITKRLDDGKYLAAFTRNNVKLYETRVLNSTLAVDWAKIKQMASIVVEAILLVMSAVGVKVSPGEHAIEQAVDEVAHLAQTSSKFEKAIQTFITAWNKAGGSAYQKAKALFYLVKDSYSAKILWTVIKSLCSNMSWVDWLETSAKITATIIAAFATDGTALIAEVALIVLSAVDFARKVANIGHLETIKSEV